MCWRAQWVLTSLGRSRLWGLVLWPWSRLLSWQEAHKRVPPWGGFCDSNSQASIHLGDFLTVSWAPTSWATGLCSFPLRPQSPGPQVSLRPSLSPQTLESSVLGPGQEASLSVRDPAQDCPPAHLPALLREIVTRNFSKPEGPGTSCLSPAQPLPTSYLFSQPCSSPNNSDCSFHVSPLGGRYTRFTDEEMEA